jgi:adenylyl-sulfate kinase
MKFLHSPATGSNGETAGEQPRPGHVFWFFGLSGAGKTTLATGLTANLRQRGWPVLLLDGDVLRTGLCRDLGYSDEARTENIRRAAEVAKLAVTQGQVVVAAFITPRESQRCLTREIIGPDQLDLIAVDASLALCRQRDPKGLYRQSAAGNLPLFTGVNSVFEISTRPDLRVRTDDRSPAESGAELEVYCQSRLREENRRRGPG